MALLVEGNLAQNPEATCGGIVEHRYSPYVDNGGTCFAMAGKDFVVIVGDTRCSMGHAIHTRNSSRITQLTSKAVIATAGMQSERETLHRLLKLRIVQYKQAHRREPSLEAVGAMLSVMLYSKRFFPFYAFNVLAGIDKDGEGTVYSYDAIGSVEKLKHSASGSASSLLYPIMDCFMLGQHRQGYSADGITKLDMVDMCKDMICSATERDILTGDAAEIFVMDANGVEREVLELKKD